MRGASLAFVVLVSTGCASQTGLGRATTLAPGVFQITPAVEGSLVSVRTDSSQTTTAPWLFPGLGYRQGVTSWLDLGLRVWAFGVPNYLTAVGVAVDGKVQLFRSNRWHIALAPSVKYHVVALADAPWHLGFIELPALFGLNLGPHQIVFGLRVTDALVTGAGTNPVNTFWVGTHVGVSFRVKRVEVMPEVGILYSPVSFNGETRDENRTGASVLHVGLSVSIEGGRELNAHISQP
jgi:hypothetical protein